MVTVFSPFKELSAEEFRRVTEVTYLGTVNGTMAALRRMQPRDSGTILQVGSALAYRAIPLQSAYCGAKHAIQGFSESVRSELLHDGSQVRISMVQLPAINTPQFDWSRNKMGMKAQPVPPIYQPEVAAEAIYWACHRTPREMNVGTTASLIITLNHFFPGLGDRYLAANGYHQQMTGEPESPDRPDNLWEPIEGDRGADGSHGEQARSFSKQLWVNTHRPWLAAGAGAVLAGAAAIVAARSRGPADRALAKTAGPGPGPGPGPEPPRSRSGSPDL